jgi:hypothetical protein
MFWEFRPQPGKILKLNLKGWLFSRNVGLTLCKTNHKIKKKHSVLSGKRHLQIESWSVLNPKLSLQKITTQGWQGQPLAFFGKEKTFLRVLLVSKSVLIDGKGRNS